jgi:hypothetical protein
MRAHGIVIAALALIVIPVAFYAITLNNLNYTPSRNHHSSTSFLTSTSQDASSSTTTTSTIESTMTRATSSSSSSTSTTTTTRSSTTTTSSSSTSSSSSTTTTSSNGRKQSLIYLAGVNYNQAVKDYSTREGITALGPQVYALDSKGNVFLADESFDPSSFTNLAHAAGFKVIPLVMAGSGLCNRGPVWCSDSVILAIINNATQLHQFEQELVSLCQTYGFDGFQLDWETGLNSSYQSAMTSALNSIANSLHAISSSLSLSLTTYYWDYHAGPYNTWALSEGSIDQLNLQDYTNSVSTFESQMNSMEQGIASPSKLAVGMGDYSGVNPPIAGQCMQYLLQSGINAVAAWPSWGTELSNGGYGYSDTVYHTTSYYQLFGMFLSAS